LGTTVIFGVFLAVINFIYGNESSGQNSDLYYDLEDQMISAYDESAASCEAVRENLNSDRTVEDGWVVKQHILYVYNLYRYRIATFVTDIRGNDIYNTVNTRYIFLRIYNIRDSDGNIVDVWYEMETNEVWSQLFDKWSQVGFTSGNIKFDDVYLKGREFCPGHAEVISGDGQVVFEVDMTPENTEGYTHIEAGDASWECGTSMAIMYKMNSVIEGSIPQKSINAALDGLDELKAVDYSYVDLHEYNSLSCNSSNVTDFTLDNGTHYLYVAGQHFSFLWDYGRYIKIIGAAVLLLSLIFAICITFYRYHRQNTLYNMDKYRRSLTDAMAHDLKTPLMALSGYAENLSEDINPEKNKEYIESIRRNTEHMNKMISDILELSKAEGTQLEKAKENVDLRSATEEILQKYRVCFDNRKLTVNISGDAVIRTNQVYLQQAMENIIGNAAKYGDEGSTIHIEIEKKKYIVKNAFSGSLDIPVEKLTEAFVKGDKSRTNKNNGTGVGLSITRALLEQQGYTLKLSLVDGLFVAEIKL
jgi:cbb3-type cytochrome oxidase subunit 3